MSCPVPLPEIPTCSRRLRTDVSVTPYVASRIRRKHLVEGICQPDARFGKLFVGDHLLDLKLVLTQG